MGTRSTAAPAVALLEPPGFLMLNYGVQTPLVSLAAHIAYGALVVGYLLLLWWRPTPQFGFLLTVVIWFALALVGTEALRRQTAREFPGAEPTHLSDALRPVVARLETRRRTGSAAGELERLAQLRREGLLDEAEFRSAKARLLGMQ